jgi:hypothetical protein
VVKKLKKNSHGTSTAMLRFIKRFDEKRHVFSMGVSSSGSHHAKCLQAVHIDLIEREQP